MFLSLKNLSSSHPSPSAKIKIHNLPFWLLCPMIFLYGQLFGSLIPPQWWQCENSWSYTWFPDAGINVWGTDTGAQAEVVWFCSSLLAAWSKPVWPTAVPHRYYKPGTESLVFQLHCCTAAWSSAIYGESKDKAVRDFNKCREHCMGKVLLSQ